MRCAVIDIGSNTIKISIYSSEDPSKSVTFKSNSAKLISHICNGELNDEGKEKLVSVLRSYVKFALKRNCDKIYCFATASLRMLDEPEKLIEYIKEKTSVEIELLSGEKEAYYSFIGMLRSVTEKSGIMLDMGGGSTEIVEFSNGKIINSVSCSFGCLKLRELYVKYEYPTEKETEQLCSYVKSYIDAYPWIRGHDVCVLIGGTGKSIGKLNLRAGGRRRVLSHREFKLLCNRWCYPSEEDRILLEKLFPARYKTIIPGIDAYNTILTEIGVKKIVVADGGVREGYITEKLAGR